MDVNDSWRRNSGEHISNILFRQSLGVECQDSVSDFLRGGKFRVAGHCSAAGRLSPLRILLLVMVSLVVVLVSKTAPVHITKELLAAGTAVLVTDSP